jgi:site-specific DNA-cytosine methylase
MPRHFDLIAFDWDGTLYDSTAFITRAIQSACRDVGVAVPPTERAAYVIGLGLQDARADLSELALEAVRRNRPFALVLEESDMLPSFQGGGWWRGQVPRMKGWGYEVSLEVYNAKLHGVPQNRPRLWVVGLRVDALGAGRPFPRLSPITAEDRPTLADILRPLRVDDDPGRLSIGQTVGANVRAVAEKARSQVMQRGLGGHPIPGKQRCPEGRHAVLASRE